MSYLNNTFDHQMNTALRDPARWDEMVSDSRRLVPVYMWLTRRIEAVDDQLTVRAGHAARLEAQLPDAQPMVASEIRSQLQQFTDWASRAEAFRKVSVHHRQLVSDLIRHRGQADIEMLLRVIATLAAGVIRFSVDDINFDTLVAGVDVPVALGDALLTPRILGERYLREMSQTPAGS